MSNVDPPISRIRRRVLFSGRVQGVGFRFTVATIAQRFPVSGTVRNLPDGSVELIEEGKPAVLDDFEREIQRAFLDNIEGIDSQQVEIDTPMNGFEIRRR